MPTPEDLSQVPLWETYVVTQAVRATLGLIPQSALAIAVEILGPKIRLLFQLSRVTAEDKVDMEDITSELEDNLGQQVDVTFTFEIRKERKVNPGGRDGIWWIFLARDDYMQSL